MPTTKEQKVAAMAKARAAKGNGKGSGNVSLSLRDCILRAATRAGGEGGLENYLTRQAQNNPVAFLSLLGKVLPLEVKAQASNELRITIRTIAEVDGAIIDVTPNVPPIEDKG